MDIKDLLNIRLIGIIGAILVIISEFLPWFSDQSCFDIYLLYTNIAIEDAFLFLFPFVSGCICLIGSFLIIYNREYKINSVITIFIGLGFLTLFIFEIIQDELFLISNTGFGFYMYIIGFFIIIFNTIVILKVKE